MDSSGAGLGRRTNFCEGSNPTLVPGKQEISWPDVWILTSGFEIQELGEGEQVKITEMCYHAAWTRITQPVLLFIVRLIFFFMGSSPDRWRI